MPTTSASEIWRRPRNLVDADQPTAAAPADREQPGVRIGGRAAGPRQRAQPRRVRAQRGLPAVEPQRARVRIDPAAREQVPAIARVVAAVQEHVADGVAHLGRRAQRARVVALREQLAAPPEQHVQPPRQPDRQPLHATRERHGAGGLDDEVQVVAQHVVVHHAEVATAPAGRARRAHHPRHRLAPEAGQPADHLERHVQRHRRREPHARPMRARAQPPLAPRPRSPPAAAARPARVLQRQLAGPSSTVQALHDDFGTIIMTARSVNAGTAIAQWPSTSGRRPLTAALRPPPGSRSAPSREPPAPVAA